MKYKLYGITACIAVVLLCILIPSAAEDSGKKIRVHQHLTEKEKISCTHEDDSLCTHLPLVVIDTQGQEIPGKNIVNEKGKIIGQEKTDDGLDEIYGTISIVDQENNNNHLGDVPALESRMVIHIRGNSSRSFDKSSFSVRLVDEEGKSSPEPVMGMDAHHEWVLHGPYLDKTLIRNYMWYNLAGEIMDYAPNVRFCEVVVNEEYQGLYVMAESITAGDEPGSRLDFSVNKKENTFTGYLLRLDRGSDNDWKNIGTFTQYSRRTNLQLNIVYPGTKNLTEEIRSGIIDDFSQFEKTLYSYDYDDGKLGYKRLIDVDSFADYFLINELTCNYDAGWLSTYIYKSIDGKYRMCVWDFNSCCDGYETQFLPDSDFQMQDCLWYFMLMKDEDFTDRIVSRYWELREKWFDEDYLDNYIDDVVRYLGSAVDRNYEKWGYSFEEEHDLLEPTSRNPRTYEEAIADMKDFLHARLAWMDENIEVVRQYSAESKVKKFNDNAN